MILTHRFVVIPLALMWFSIGSSAYARIGGTPKEFQRFFERTYGKSERGASPLADIFITNLRWPDQKGAGVIQGELGTANGRIFSQSLTFKLVDFEDRRLAELIVPFVAEATGQPGIVSADRIYRMIKHVFQQLPSGIDIYTASADRIEEAAKRQRRTAYPKSVIRLGKYQLILSIGFYTGDMKAASTPDFTARVVAVQPTVPRKSIKKAR